MALNGPEPLDDHDLAAADREAQVQAAFLERFRADVELNTPPELAIPTAPPEPGQVPIVTIPTEPGQRSMTAAEFAARAEQYAGSTWGAAINARRERVKSGRKMKWERRRHVRPMSEHDACTTCDGESAKGWVPIGTLLPIGDSECLGIHCDCYFEFSEERPAA